MNIGLSNDRNVDKFQDFMVNFIAFVEDNKGVSQIVTLAKDIVTKKSKWLQ